MNAKNDSSRSRAGSNASATDAPPPPRAAYNPPPRPPGRAGAGASAAVGGSSKGSFVNISDEDKTAFFELLDEYFGSRPEYKALFSQAEGSRSTPPVSRPVVTAAPLPPPSRQTPPPSAPKPPTRRGIGTAVALYDYDGAEAEDLSFKEGDSIVVMEHGEYQTDILRTSSDALGPIVSDDWWKGETGGRAGLFPSAYVQMQ
jgi:hypothetical protein